MVAVPGLAEVRAGQLGYRHPFPVCAGAAVLGPWAETGASPLVAFCREAAVGGMRLAMTDARVDCSKCGVVVNTCDTSHSSHIENSSWNP
jgi:hypothetical protein